MNIIKIKTLFALLFILAIVSCRNKNYYFDNAYWNILKLNDTTYMCIPSNDEVKPYILKQIK